MSVIHHLGAALAAIAIAVSIAVVINHVFSGKRGRRSAR